jgi:hypothetical protein
MEPCPNCGAAVDGYAHNGSQKHYCCGSWVPGDPEDRTRECYEAELDNLKTIIRIMYIGLDINHSKELLLRFPEVQAIMKEGE